MLACAAPLLSRSESVGVEEGDDGAIQLSQHRETVERFDPADVVGIIRRVPDRGKKSTPVTTPNPIDAIVIILFRTVIPRHDS